MSVSIAQEQQPNHNIQMTDSDEPLLWPDVRCEDEEFEDEEFEDGDDEYEDEEEYEEEYEEE